jgi:GTP pyrophosphokinase
MAQCVTTSKARTRIKVGSRDDRKAKSEDGRFLVEKRLEL